MNLHRTPPSGTPRALAMTTALLVGACALAHAQDVPYIDAVGAYNHANVMTRPAPADAGSDKTTDDGLRHPANSGDGTISRARFDAIVSDLRSEYHARSKRDGKPAADAWLRREVAVLKQRYTTVHD